ncbi:Eco29kI family restriction endonuclease [Hyalangium gracile]|uniref:Eco29kI family restriction endonuclease n=1 Tax=Hyalangium gracile TaxID=394092 RepID=UPI001CCB218E|nr:Eco29kI family restriction endonuclease [Hyalangium gracile]
MAAKLDINALLEHLATLQKLVPAGDVDLPPLSSAKVKRLRDELKTSVDRLEGLDYLLNPLKMPKTVFDPSDPHVVGRLIGDTLLQQERVSLESVDKFYGSGVYAIYYLGSFDAYEPISRTDTPIYVGKADPADRYAQDVREQGERLSSRLKDHRRSITWAENLDIRDFDCRFLVVKTAWESTAEDYLINRFRPVWNSEMKVCFGFGKHGDSAKVRGNTRSPWDTLHPGRPWADEEGNKPNPLGIDGIKKQIAAHFEKNPPLYPEKSYSPRPPG